MLGRVWGASCSRGSWIRFAWLTLVSWPESPEPGEVGVLDNLGLSQDMQVVYSALLGSDLVTLLELSRSVGMDISDVGRSSPDRWCTSVIGEGGGFRRRSGRRSWVSSPPVGGRLRGR